MKKFLGVDYEELAEHWGIVEAEDTEDSLLQKIKAHIGAAIKLNDETVAQDIRAFLKELARESKNNSYDYPVWQGMLKIKDDQYGNEALMKITIKLLDDLWT